MTTDLPERTQKAAPLRRRSILALVGVGVAGAATTAQTKVANAAGAVSNFVKKTGDRMTGSLHLLSKPGDESADRTSRLTVESYQMAYRRNYGEGIRMLLKSANAKNMIAWYDAFTNPKYPRPIAWVGAHYGTHIKGLIHKHWSVETTTANGELHSRFTITYGENIAVARFNAAHVQVTSSQGGRMWLTVSPQQQRKQDRSLIFATGVNANVRERRWAIVADTTAESGYGSGSDLRFVRYSNSGAPLSTALRISRQSGQLTTPHDMVFSSSGRGPILTSPNGGKWRLNITNSGALYVRRA